MNNANGEGEYNEIIPRTRDMLPRGQTDKNATKFYTFY